MRSYKARFVYFILGFVAAVLMDGWVLQLMWQWFVVPTFDLRSLNIVQAMGISLMVTFLTYHGDTSANRSTSLMMGTINTFGYPILTLVLGWIVHLFM